MIAAEVDLHCHLLPAWDDGPRNEDGSLLLAQRAASAGIKQILVTPHVGRAFGHQEERASRDIPAATQALQKLLHEASIDITLVPGAELSFEADIPFDQVVAQPWLTVNGQKRYLLIESISGRWPRYAEAMLYQVSLTGVIPIIAHPERYPEVQEDPNVLQHVLRSGALLQITARSLKNEDLKSSSVRHRHDCSRRLMEAGMVSIIASDSHSDRSVWPGEVEDEVRALVGDEAARQILHENPKLILAGEPVPPLSVNPPAREKKRWFLGSLFGQSRR